METSLIPLASNIWLFPPDPDPRRVQPAVGVILTAGGTILVDAGNGQPHARRVLAALDALHAPPVEYIIYTHHHWDHVFGAQLYRAPVIAHGLCRDILSERAAIPWSYAWLEDAMEKNPALERVYQPMQRAVDEWQKFRIVTPTLTFDRQMRLHRDGAIIELAHVGGDHAPDSVIVRVGGVMFLGDCIYPPFFAETEQRRYDRALIERLLADEQIHTYVAAHHPEPLSRADFAALGID